MPDFPNDWRDHARCEWTWPNGYGIVGCPDHGVVFEAPTGEEAWGIMPATALGAGLQWTP